MRRWFWSHSPSYGVILQCVAPGWTIQPRMATICIHWALCIFFCFVAFALPWRCLYFPFYFCVWSSRHSCLVPLCWWVFHPASCHSFKQSQVGFSHLFSFDLVYKDLEITTHSLRPRARTWHITALATSGFVCTLYSSTPYTPYVLSNAKADGKCH